MTPKRRKLWRVMASLLAGIALAVWLGREREPTYQGRPLSRWLIHLVPSNPASPKKREAEEAIRHIGTNAIPYLLKWLRYEKPASRSFANAPQWFLDALPPSVRDHMPGSILDLLSTDWGLLRATASTYAFAQLGTTATPASASLEKLLQDPSQANTCIGAMYSLAAISTNVPPVVLTRLSDPDPEQRVQALFCLAEFCAHLPDLTPTLPSLQQCLGNTNERVRSYAIFALRGTNLPSPLVLPALTNAMSDSSYAVRRRATNAVLEIMDRGRTNAPPQ